MPSPDPEAAFIARIREIVGDIARLSQGFPVVTVDTSRTKHNCVVVQLGPGQTEIRNVIDRVRFTLLCYGDDPRTLAYQVRDGLGAGFTAGGQRVFRVTADPPFPLDDPQTFETRFLIGVSASMHAAPA